MDQSIKLVQSQPTSQSAPTAQGSDAKPIVEKILEEIREKRKHFLDSIQAQQQIDQLEGEIQELKKVKISIKPKSPDKKEELPASSPSNDPPPPPDPPKVKPTKAPPQPSRRTADTPEPAEPQAIANQKSTTNDAPPPPKPTKAPPRPSRRHRPATPEQVEPEVIAN